MPPSPEVLEHGLRRLRLRLTFAAFLLAAVSSTATWAYFDSATNAQREWRKHEACRTSVAGLQNDPAFMLREFWAQPITIISPRPIPVHTATQIGHMGDSIPGDAASKAFGRHDETRPHLVVFTDYECSACRCFEKQRNQLVDAAFEGNLIAELRHFPRSREPVYGSAIATESMLRQEVPPLSLALEAARRIGGEEGYMALHWTFLESQVSQSDLPKAARRAGLDADAFQTAMNSPEIRAVVDEDIRTGTALGIETTPAVFLNGRRVPALCLKSRVFWQAIAAEFRSSNADGSVTDALHSP